MVVEIGNFERERALRIVENCRDKMVENEMAMWLNAAFAHRCGATLAQVAYACNVSTETARRRLRDVDSRNHRQADVKLGDRVFVAGTVGKYGKLTAIIRTLGPPYYTVHLDGSDAPSGPYTEVWPELKAPNYAEKM